MLLYVLPPLVVEFVEAITKQLLHFVDREWKAEDIIRFVNINSVSPFTYGRINQNYV